MTSYTEKHEGDLFGYSFDPDNCTPILSYLNEDFSTFSQSLDRMLQATVGIDGSSGCEFLLRISRSGKDRIASENTIRSWYRFGNRPKKSQDSREMIDARNYYTEVDRTLNEWNEWQLKNLSAIVWLYRGEKEKYQALIQQYHVVLGNKPFAETADALAEQIKAIRTEAKAAVNATAKREKKSVQAQYDEQMMQADIMLTHREKTLIIDAKYYAHPTQIHYDKHTLHSGNMYQIFTYVKNKEVDLADRPHEVSGMLLYAKTDEEIYRDNEYSMSGNRIAVRTLDLSGGFDLIRAQLDAIVHRYLETAG